MRAFVSVAGSGQLSLTTREKSLGSMVDELLEGVQRCESTRMAIASREAPHQSMIDSRCQGLQLLLIHVESILSLDCFTLPLLELNLLGILQLRAWSPLLLLALPQGGLFVFVSSEIVRAHLTTNDSTTNIERWEWLRNTPGRPNQTKRMAPTQ